jgi:hypothetical protein
VEFFCKKEMIYTGSAGIWCEARTGGPLPSLQPGWGASQAFYFIFLYFYIYLLFYNSAITADPYNFESTKVKKII